MALLPGEIALIDTLDYLLTNKRFLKGNIDWGWDGCFLSDVVLVRMRVDTAEKYWLGAIVFGVLWMAAAGDAATISPRASALLYGVTKATPLICFLLAVGCLTAAIVKTRRMVEFCTAAGSITVVWRFAKGKKEALNLIRTFGRARAGLVSEQVVEMAAQPLS